MKKFNSPIKPVPLSSPHMFTDNDEVDVKMSSAAAEKSSTGNKNIPSTKGATSNNPSNPTKKTSNSSGKAKSISAPVKPAASIMNFFKKVV